MGAVQKNVKRLRFGKAIGTSNRSETFRGNGGKLGEEFFGPFHEGMIANGSG